MKTVLIPSTYEPSGEHADKLAIFANRLLHLTAIKKKRWNGHYIRFGAREWERLFGTRYGPVKRAAIATGLIDENPKYSTKRFSMSLRLCDEHRHGNTREYVLKRKRNLRRVRIDQESIGELGSWLVQHFDRVSFRPGTDQRQCLTNPWVRLTFDTVRRTEWRAKRDRYGRFHSNFTTLKKELRRRLQLDNDRILNSDISSSQPLILAVLTYSGHKYRQDTANMGAMDFSCPTICAVKPRLKPDVEHWLELCSAGQLYQFFQDRFQAGDCASVRRRKRRPADLSIKQIKDEVMRTMFSKIKTMERNPVFCVMGSHFPTLVEHLRATKQDDYRQMAWDCQHLESLLVIDGACGELMRLHPDEPIITVHDEIIYREQQAVAVEAVLKEQFARVGVDVNVKSEGKAAGRTVELPKGDAAELPDDETPKLPL